MGLVAGQLGGTNHFRYCEQCLVEDEDVHGQGYWHRAHQLPGVLVCYRHGWALNVVPVEWIHRHRHSLFLPTDGKVQHMATPIRIAVGDVPMLQKIALLSAHALHGRHERLDQAALRHHYLQLANRLGLASDSGRLHVTVFCDRMNTFLHALPKIEDFQRLQKNVNDIPAWALKLMRKAKGASHPLKHILLKLCLQAEWLGQSPRQSAIGLPSEIYVKIDKSPKHSSTIDLARFASLIMKEEKSLRQCSAILGVGITTLRIAAVRSGLPVKSKPKLLNGKVLYCLKAALSSTPSKVEVARQFGVSLVSVYRILAMFPEIRKLHQRCILLRDRRQRRARFLEEIKSLTPRRTKDYAWFLRHDHAWMKKAAKACNRPVAPPAMRVNWPIRDKALAESVLVHVQKLLAQEKPVRITKSAVGRSMNEMATFDKFLSHLPLTANVLAPLVETTQAFQCRRVSWAAKQLQAQGLRLDAWRLMRVAGIKSIFTKNVSQLVGEIVNSQHVSPAKKDISD